MNQSGVIYSYELENRPHHTDELVLAELPRKNRRISAPSPKVTRNRAWSGILGIGLLALSLGGMTAPHVQTIALETQYALSQAKAWKPVAAILGTKQPAKPVAIDQPQAVPAVFNPLVSPDGSTIEPKDREFGIVIPKIGVNAGILPNIDPTKPTEYLPALLRGIAHASTSFLPDEDGTVYLFSHSTNYDWFVADLNAVFYLLKNLETGDMVVVMYKQKQYVYKITDKRIVKPSAVSYLVPERGIKQLILQTCWPPGSTTERLLIFADLVEVKTEAI